MTRRKSALTYAGKFAVLFGENIYKNTNLLVAEATFAVGRYQIEEPSFHPPASMITDVGGFSTANIEFESIPADVNTVFGPNSPTLRPSRFSTVSRLRSHLRSFETPSKSICDALSPRLAIRR